jgi:hypothetical protein
MSRRASVVVAIGCQASKHVHGVPSGERMSEQRGWYFTAPWDPVPVRRGDALGLRAGADYFAELLAPGLSNNTSDARWISLLSWCLKWSHIVWRNAGGGDLSRRDERMRPSILGLPESRLYAGLWEPGPKQSAAPRV